MINCEPFVGREMGVIKLESDIFFIKGPVDLFSDLYQCYVSIHIFVSFMCLHFCCGIIPESGSVCGKLVYVEVGGGVGM